MTCSPGFVLCAAVTKREVLTTLQGHIYKSILRWFFIALTLIFFPLHPFLEELFGNIIPKNQPPLAAAFKSFCTLNCPLAAHCKKHQKFRSYCCFKQIILAFMFENLINNQLSSGLHESVLLCLQQQKGISRGQKLEFNVSNTVAREELLRMIGLPAPPSPLSSWDATCIQETLLPRRTVATKLKP